jgi:hypothetical protein
MMTLIRRTAVGAGLAASILIATGVATGMVADAAAPSVKVKSKYFVNSETTLACDAGQVATGGGVGADNPYDTYVARTEPTFNGSRVPTGWKGTLISKNGTASSGSIYVVCAS